MWFHFSAAKLLIKRRKGPVFRMMIVAFIGTLWLVGGAVWTLSTYRDIQEQAMNVQVDILLNTITSDQEARSITRRVAAMEEVDRSRLMHEMDVWREFTGEVGVDDDLRAVVSMPRIVRFSPTTTAATRADVENVVGRIRSRYAALIEEVVWPVKYVDTLDKRRKDLLLLGSTAGALSLVMFMIGLIYAFRAEIHVAGGDLRVGSLLGAPPRWIVTPHILVGMFAGFVGLVLAGAAIYALIATSIDEAPWLKAVKYEEFAAMAIAIASIGLILSVWQSLREARKAVRTMDT